MAAASDFVRPPVTPKSRGYVFTLNNPTSGQETRLKDFAQASCKYMVFGREVAPSTGTPHLQGFLYLKSQKTWRALKDKLRIESIHLEAARGNASQNFDYATKDGDFWEFGDRPTQGKRKDLDTVREMVKDKKSMLEILDNVSSYQAARFAQLYSAHQPPPPRESGGKRVFIYGPSGSGKSTLARALIGESYYTADLAPWFDGYNSTDPVLFDDFRSSDFPFNRFLRLLDPWPVRLSVKGASVPVISSTIIVTSIKSPWDVYSGSGEDQVQFMRRFDEIIIAQPSQFDMNTLITKVKQCPSGQTPKVLKFGADYQLELIFDPNVL